MKRNKLSEYIQDPSSGQFDISQFLILTVLNSGDALRLKIQEDKILHLPGATAAKEGDDDDNGRDADEDVGGGIVDVEVKSINVLPCNIFRLQQLQPQHTIC